MAKKSLFINENLKRGLLIAVIGYGIAIRLVEYFSNRSFWVDEFSLVLNIIHKSPWELITRPLDEHQFAPIGFLVLTKYLVSFFNNNELVFRFIPLLSGTISIFIFYKFLRSRFTYRCQLIALSLFSLSMVLIRYSSEFKPYSCDLLCALVILMSGFSLLKDEETPIKSFFLFTLLGCISFLFSSPSPFTWMGLWFVLMFCNVKDKNSKMVGRLLICLAVYAAVFGCLYLLLINSLFHSDTIKEYYKINSAEGFIFFPPRSLEDQFRVVNQILKYFYFPGMVQPIAGAAIFLIGCFSISKKDKKIFWALLMPFLLVLMAACLRVYPFSGRFLLFTVPVLYLMMSQGLVFLLQGHSRAKKLCGVIFLLILFVSPFKLNIENLFHPAFYTEDINPIFKKLRSNLKNNDTIYVYHETVPIFQYYAKSFNLDKTDYVLGTKSLEGRSKYNEELIKFKAKGRVWFIFSHVYRGNGPTEEDYMLNYLNSMGTPLDNFHDSNVSVYLYNLDKH